MGCMIGGSVCVGGGLSVTSGHLALLYVVRLEAHRLHLLSGFSS